MNHIKVRGKLTSSNKVEVYLLEVQGYGSAFGNYSFSSIAPNQQHAFIHNGVCLYSHKVYTRPHFFIGKYYRRVTPPQIDFWLGVPFELTEKPFKVQGELTLEQWALMKEAVIAYNNWAASKEE